MAAAGEGAPVAAAWCLLKNRTAASITVRRSTSMPTKWPERGNHTRSTSVAPMVPASSRESSIGTVQSLPAAVYHQGRCQDLRQVLLHQLPELNQAEHPLEGHSHVARAERRHLLVDHVEAARFGQEAERPAAQHAGRAGPARAAATSIDRQPQRRRHDGNSGDRLGMTSGQQHREEASQGKACHRHRTTAHLGGQEQESLFGRG